MPTPMRRTSSQKMRQLTDDDVTRLKQLRKDMRDLEAKKRNLASADAAVAAAIETVRRSIEETEGEIERRNLAHTAYANDDPYLQIGALVAIAKDSRKHWVECRITDRARFEDSGLYIFKTERLDGEKALTPKYAEDLFPVELARGGSVAKPPTDPPR